uniref:Uncharacterized protein n=1 Tax=Knipowitschia caucasica TaxID=637954 RepID=A0AAV2M7N3_KNICA
MLETTFASQEKLNKAHVTPQQKAFTSESPQRHQSLPRPIKSVQRSMSDPKPLSPTLEDPAKNRFSPYHQQALSNSQMAALQQQQNSLMRKVKRTLPSPPPEESPLPIVTPAQMYSSPGISQRVLPRSTQGVTKAGLLNELKAVEQESSKLRKQQAELEEEEKEIDAKLRCLELGITQRKETMVKDRERRELAYLRCMGDARDYMSDSELNNLSRQFSHPFLPMGSKLILIQPQLPNLEHFNPILQLDHHTKISQVIPPVPMVSLPIRQILVCSIATRASILLVNPCLVKAYHIQVVPSNLVTLTNNKLTSLLFINDPDRHPWLISNKNTQQTMK